MTLRSVMLAMLLICCIGAPLQAQTILARDVLGSGGSDMSNGTHRITATVGQAVIGTASGSAWTAGEGFWYRILSAPNAIEDPPALVARPVLRQNYPNPFNPSTTIEFTLPVQAHVRLALYRPTGQLLRVLIDGAMSAGIHRIQFEAGILPAGIYVCRLTSGKFFAEQKMVLLK